MGHCTFRILDLCLLLLIDMGWLLVLGTCVVGLCLWVILFALVCVFYV